MWKSLSVTRLESVILICVRLHSCTCMAKSPSTSLANVFCARFFILKRQSPFLLRIALKGNDYLKPWKLCAKSMSYLQILCLMFFLISKKKYIDNGNKGPKTHIQRENLYNRKNKSPSNWLNPIYGLNKHKWQLTNHKALPQHNQCMS